MRRVYHPIARVDEVPAGSHRLVEIPDAGDCVLFRTDDGGFHLTGALCPHQNEPLDSGHLEGCELVCRRHHLRFDIRTGECTNAAGYWLQTLDVKVEGDAVLVGMWED